MNSVYWTAQGRPAREAGKKAAAAIAASGMLQGENGSRRGVGRPAGSGWKQRCAAAAAAGNSLLVLAAAAASSSLGGDYAPKEMREHPQGIQRKATFSKSSAAAARVAAAAMRVKKRYSSTLSVQVGALLHACILNHYYSKSPGLTKKVA
jgi:hypothetical protein